MTTKTRTYAQVKAEIDALQHEAEALRQQEIAAVLDEVRAKVAEYGLTAQDIFGRKRASNSSDQQKGKTSLLPKYRDPKSGATWTGRGRAPSWLVGVKNRARFLIDQA